MTSVGETLKNARLEKGFSLDEAVHETNISKNYIEALESEAFEEFPAEAYLIGFLRNYSEFLSLNSEKMIMRYKNHMLSGEPIPMEELLGKRINIPWKKIVLSALAVAIIVSLVIFLRPIFSKIIEKIEEQQIAETIEEEAKTHILEAEYLETSLADKDKLVIVHDDIDYIFSVAISSKRLTLTAKDPSLFKGHETKYTLAPGENTFVFTKGKTADVRLYCRDFDAKSKTFSIQMQRLKQEDVAKIENKDNSALLGEEGANTESEKPPSGLKERMIPQKVIYTSTRPENFTLNIVFRGFCLFRYQADNKELNQKFYSDSNTFRLDVYRSVVLWGSNAGSIEAKIKGDNVPLGKAGEVVARVIYWQKNSAGSYDLIVAPRY